MRVSEASARTRTIDKLGSSQRILRSILSLPAMNEGVVGEMKSE